MFEEYRSGDRVRKSDSRSCSRTTAGVSWTGARCVVRPSSQREYLLMLSVLRASADGCTRQILLSW